MASVEEKLSKLKFALERLEKQCGKQNYLIVEAIATLESVTASVKYIRDSILDMETIIEKKDTVIDRYSLLIKELTRVK